MTVPNPNQSIIDRLQRHLEAVIADCAKPSGNYALLDFPNHSNVGDSAIYVGELILLERHFRRKPSLVTEATESALEALGRRPASEPVFLHGGGNFGDLWPRHQLFREAVLKRFPDRRIIQLPQSIHFADHANLERAAEAINSHPNFALMVRDEASAAIARSAFTCDVSVVPDAAFMIGPLPASAPPDSRVLCLLRDDKEKVIGDLAALTSLPEPSMVADWPVEPWRRDPFNRLPGALRRLLPPSAQGYRPITPAAYEWLARKRVQRGVDLLSRGDIVITDRLHAHILCVLLGKPHVVLDNSYGKISNFMSAFTSDVKVQRAASLEEATELASSTLRAD